jgi:hypothetical protein
MGRDCPSLVAGFTTGEDQQVRVEFAKREGGGSLATIERPDGTRLLLTSYDRVHAVPHDLAHFVTEQTLGVTGGLFGSIAAGALFDSLRVLSGRRRHDDVARSDAIRRANAADLQLAEVLVGAAHGGLAVGDAEGGHRIERAWSSVRPTPCPYSSERRVAAVAELRRLGRSFAELDGGQTLALEWTVASAPPRRRRKR